MRVAAVQLNSNADKARNLEMAEGLVREAAGAGAELIALPEKWNLLAPGPEQLAGAERLDGPTLEATRGWARELGVAILAGSIPERSDDPGRGFNTSVLISPEGDDLGVYRKIHLFDVDLAAQGGSSYRESAAVAPGSEVVVAETPFGGVGLSICYDVRFPELYRALAARGARFLLVPSAFARETGRDHWEVLLRARAIENQCFVIAPAQWGQHSPERASHGRALIADPWGVLLGVAPDRQGVVVADCDLAQQDRVRASLPALQHRRL
jgi:predicted amidohydrolase